MSGLRPIDGSAKRVVTGEELRRRRIDADAEDSAVGARIRLAPGVLGRPPQDDEEAVAKLAAEQEKAEEADRRYVPNRAEMRRHRKGARRAR